jgi:hypothetical protein
MGSVFDSLRTTYSDMFDRMLGPKSYEVLSDSAASVARDAYGKEQNATAGQKYAAAKVAVADLLAPMTPLTAPAVADVFDTVHAQPPAPVTPETSTARSVSDAARKTANLAPGGIRGTLRLSVPSQLGTWARVVFGVISAIVAGGSVYLIYRLADDSHSRPSAVVYAGLAIAILMAMLTLLFCVTGYSNVSIEGSRVENRDEGGNEKGHENISLVGQPPIGV